ncbi:amidase [Seongchinamella sediminis]|uniref:Amidase n=2 Tax=Seongchinamella sediminis TaxID=2283635 RepID=A0A3L7DXW7_9GAMM|nr:amidase [Seongchinamella sediminis]
MGSHADSPLYWSVAKLQAAYQSGELSPVEVLEEALQRIDRFNPQLNAYLGRLDDLARAQALAAERAWRSGEPGPLCGVPVSIKDTFHIEGHVATYGSLAFRDNIAESDSGVVRRLRAAGSVFTGRTNTSEFAQSATAENRFFDDSHNPWDVTRTTGGSSGGAAASVAAGLSTLAVGADGGGSIRIPASFTGLFGIKPTYGLCQDENGLSAMSDFISPGPFAWRVSDARVMCGVLADTTYRRQKVTKGLRVAWCARPSGCPHDPGVVEVTEAAVKLLVEMGHCVAEHPLDLTGWEAAFAPLVLHNEFRERDHLLETSADRLTGYERRSLEMARSLSAEQVEQGHREHAVYRARIQRLFEEFDIVVLPTTAVTAFPIKERPSKIDGQDVHWLWGPFPGTAPFNVAGNPAATVPCGFADSLPVGLQLVGAQMSEELLLNLAEDLEEALAIDRTPLVDKWAMTATVEG